jgi:hypothetical protein
MDKYKTFNEYKDKIINAMDNEDAISLISIATSMTNDPIEIKLLVSLTNNNRYNKNMDIKKFMLYTTILENIQYYDDANIIIEDIELNISDNAQLNAFKRIIKYKPRQLSPDNKHNKIQKECPHCKKIYNGTVTTKYVICGYTHQSNKGFDWKGCGKDWCFTCGKKLCKNWDTNILYNQTNRYHDGKCCKNSAIKNNENYILDYCQCSNEHVMRYK